MDAVDVARLRLGNQHLTGPPLPDPVAVVRWFGAMQAQEFAVAKWSVGQRVAGCADADVQRLVDAGSILRTHALRPTWHFVAAADVAWIQALTGPRVHVGNGYYYRTLGIDDDLAARTARLFADALRGGNHLTRPELGAVLAGAGIEASGNRLAYLVLHAELDGLIANGVMRGRQHTYALVAERVPDPLVLDPDAALAELTRRYFTSHGPATVKDFGWWSSLTVAQIRRGLDLVGAALARVDVDGVAYWHVPEVGPVAGAGAHVLQGYDEYVVAYTESRPMINLAGLVAAAPNENTLTHPLIVDGQWVGFWRRTVERAAITARLTPARPLTAPERAAVAAAFDRYAAFAGVPVRVVWP